MAQSNQNAHIVATLHFTALGEDLVHPAFQDAALAKQSLAIQLVNAGINQAAWATRSELGEAFFAARRKESTHEVIENSWITNTDRGESGLNTAPKYDRDERDGAAVALALIALGLDHEFVPPRPTYIAERVMSSVERMTSSVSNKADKDKLSGLLAASDDALIQQVIADTYVSFKTDWLVPAELEAGIWSIIDCPASQMSKISAGDILQPKDVIRAQTWAIGDPLDERKYGAIFTAMRAGESAQVKIMLEALEDLKAIEAQLFPVNEAD